MFLEKFSRFIRIYEILLNARHTRGAALPLTADDGEYSVLDALHLRIDADAAHELQPNGDTIELVSAQHLPKKGAVVLLFHRESPNAADPMYRRKRLKTITTRAADRQPDEAQSVSAHLIISTKPTAKAGAYKAYLEEIPGISMGAIEPIIRHALQDYQYDYTDARDQVGQTYTTLKTTGIKSETLSNALKDGRLNAVTLVRPAPPDFVDAEGIFKPVNETMTIKVTGEVTKENWVPLFSSLAKKAKNAGWQEFNVDVQFENNRGRTVSIDRDNAAKEILMIKSEEVQVKTALVNCTTEVSIELVEKALALQ